VAETIKQTFGGRLGLAAYTLIALPAALAFLPKMIWRHRPLRRALAATGERFGRLPEDLPRRPLWIHAASAGETRAALALAREIERALPEAPVVLSCQTPAGRHVAASSGRPSFYFPLDLPGPTRRALERVRPRAVLLVETELWPRFLDTCARRGVEVAVVSGRLGPGKMARYQRLAPLVRPALRGVSLCCAQSPADAERFARIGIPSQRIRVTGNLKFDIDCAPLDSAAVSPYRVRDADLVLVAGSTRPGEEEPVCEAFRSLLERRPRSLLILAPRHPQRAAEALGVALRCLGPEAARLRSSLPESGRPSVCSCVVVDRLGELSGLYSLASIAFVGGSLVRLGGHNPIEPAACGVPTLFGRHMDHQRELADGLLAAEAALEVAGAADLRRQILSLSEDPARRARLGRNGRALTEAHCGAARRTVEALADQWQWRPVAGRSAAAAVAP
jgi:3-deoxy-D-manno-octulosonic-acid transferase